MTVHHRLHRLGDRSYGSGQIALARPRSQRNGLSLLEVVLAAAILGGALVAISNLNYLGGRCAINAVYYSEAQIICDAKMAEIAAGAAPVASNSGTVLSAPEWTYQVEIQPAEHQGLLLVKVSVELTTQNGPPHSPVELWRLVPDPNYEPDQNVLQ